MTRRWEAAAWREGCGRRVTPRRCRRHGSCSMSCAWPWVPPLLMQLLVEVVEAVVEVVVAYYLRPCRVVQRGEEGAEVVVGQRCGLTW